MMKPWLGLAAILLLLSGMAQAQAAAPPQNETLTVGITAAPPFVIKNGDGTWRGISIDLWQEIAANLGYQYKFKPLSLSDLLKGVADGSLDVAVGALTMTAAREARFDFTHPFYTTGLAIGVPHAEGGGWWAVLQRFISWQFLSIVIVLAGLLLLTGFVVWLFERRANPDEFGGSVPHGIASSFWWAAVTMTTVGYGDKSPRTLGGRLVGLVWMFAALIIVSSFTAAITTSLTVSHLQGPIQGPDDLARVRVATIKNTISAQYLASHHIRRRFYPDLEAALAAVAAGKVGAVVYDKPLLQYRAAQMPDVSLDILPGVFEKQGYAFALPTGSRLHEPLNEQILKITSTSGWNEMVQRYLSTSQADE